MIGSRGYLILAVIPLLLLSTVAVESRLSSESTFAGRSHQWRVLGPAPADSLVDFTLGLKVRNAKDLEQLFWTVSDPASPHYKAYLSPEEIAARFGQDSTSLAAIVQWLLDSGVQKDMLSIPATRTAIRVSQVPVALVQNLFAVSLHTVTHGSRQTATRCISRCEIRVPSHIHHLVQSIEGLVDIPIIKRGLTPNKQVSATDINVTPAQIFAQYDISKESSPNCNKTAQTVAEFSGSNWLQSYSPADLTNFQRTYGLKEQPIAKLYGKNEPTQPTGEATLDIQYIMAAAQGVPTWFWGETGSYLDYLIHVQNVVDGPLVHSISYSIGDELYVDGSHMQLLNSHFQIIALRGISLIWASGDEGTGNTGMFGCGTFSPGFPASSPYITSVGATSFTTSSLETPSNPRRANSENLFRTNKYGEHAASYSGGGFSTVFPRPSYQDKFVNNYFTQMKQSLPPAAYYNATGRGFPDVSAVGTNFLIFVGGISGPPMPVSGTSAATPLFSAMLTMINNELAARGKKSVGFANVALYRAPASIWNPITSGNNAYYPCDSGFTAAAPWAPISGLGSPNFPALLNYFLSL